MRERIVGEISMPIGGMVEGSRIERVDSLYWLDQEGTVLSVAACRPVPQVGENLFAVLDTDKAERAALGRALARGISGLYLMQCGLVPVFLFGYPYAASGTLLAVIPGAPLLHALRTPAAYFEDERFCAEVMLSPFSAARTAPPYEETRQQLVEWLAPYLRLCAKEGAADEKPATLMQWLIFRTARMANAVGVDAQYDFSGLGYATVREIVYGALFTNLLALLLAARRAALPGTLYLSVKREGTASPQLYARMQLSEEEIPTEIKVAQRSLTARGIAHSVFFDPTRKGLLHAELGFCGAPMEKQGMRNPFGFFQR